MKRAILLLITLAILSSCSSIKKGANFNVLTLTGKIEQIGMTTFQYGTHLIKADNKTFALKSSNVNLDNYIEKAVTLQGKKVPGYPIDGGPELIEVSEVSTR